MSQENLDAFVKKVMEDEALEASLRTATNREEFVEKAVAAGAEKGNDFTAAEVNAWIDRFEAQMAEQRKAQAPSGEQLEQAVANAETDYPCIPPTAHPCC